MSKIDSWVTKVPRLKNSKVARFSYRAEAYANDDIEGVDSYDYAQDMNVPLATHTDFDASVLSSGARSNFSSMPKNGLNHFFGRVSYNLNKVIDFLSDLLDDFKVQGIETLRRSANFTLGTYPDGKKLRIANTHATKTITCTLPSGQTMNETFTGFNIPAGRIIDIELIGTTWRDNLTGVLVGNVTGNAGTADKWKTARNITISDADGTNTGSAVSVDGSENETLKLPPTIKANVTGNASTATKLATSRKIGSVDFDGSADITLDQIGCDYVVEDNTNRDYDAGYIKYASGRMMIRRAYYHASSTGSVHVPFNYAEFINDNVVAYCTYIDPFYNPQPPQVISASSTGVRVIYPSADLILLIEAWGRWK